MKVYEYKYVCVNYNRRVCVLMCGSVNLTHVLVLVPLCMFMGVCVYPDVYHLCVCVCTCMCMGVEEKNQERVGQSHGLPAAL